MEAAQSDALVFFGASGDLAFKQIFPALLGLVGGEGVNVPIVGVAKAGWTVDQLRERAKGSIKQHAPTGAAGLDKLLGLMRYVDGDYNDPQTFAKLKQALGGAKQNRLDVGRIRNHGDDDLSLLTDFLPVGARNSALVDQLLRRSATGVNEELVAAFHEVAGHRTPHDTETDETDLCHVLRLQRG